MVYHAYENGFYNLGRQTLLEPIEWLSDGWFRIGEVRSRAADSRSRCRRAAGAHGFALVRRFLDQQDGRAVELLRRRRRRPASAIATRTAVSCLRAKGASPADSSPLWFVTGDHAYEFEVEIDADADATAGRAAVLQPATLCRARLFGEEPDHAHLRHRTARRASRRNSGSGCICGCATTGTS